MSYQNIPRFWGTKHTEASTSTGKEIYFKTLYRTQLKKVCMVRQILSHSVSFFPSLLLAAWFLNLSLSLFHIWSIFLSADWLFCFSVRILVSLPSSHWLVHDFGLPYCQFWQWLFMTLLLLCQEHPILPPCLREWTQFEPGVFAPGPASWWES